MFSNSVARCVAVVVFAVAVGSSALAHPQSVPLTFDCSVVARVTLWEAPGGEWEQYGTNTASVTAPNGPHADIAFTSDTSIASLNTYTRTNMAFSGWVSTLEPSHLIIGTTPELPAGTPLLLSLHTQVGSLMYDVHYSLDVNRGATNLIHLDQNNPPWETPSTVTALVVAGETLDVGFSQSGYSENVLATTFTATSIPEPAGLLLFAVVLVAARRRAS